MRGTIVAVICAALVVACGKGDDGGGKGASGEGGGKTAASAAGGGSPATAAGGGAPAAGAGADGCKAACEHRKTCGVAGGDDVARCADDCALLADQLTADGLAAYAASGCEQVKQAEAGFQTAALCRRACRHRASCLPSADVAACEAECAGLIMAGGHDPAAVLGPYIGSACTTVEAEEAGFAVGGACLRACARAVECKVRGELPTCLGECAQAIRGGVVDAAGARAIAAQGCDVVGARFGPAPQAAPPRAPMAPGQSGDGCRTTGAQDCPYFTTCCSNGAYTTMGSGPGMCISPAICLMPRG